MKNLLVIAAYVGIIVTINTIFPIFIVAFIIITVCDHRCYVGVTVTINIVIHVPVIVSITATVCYHYHILWYVIFATTVISSSTAIFAITTTAFSYVTDIFAVTTIVYARLRWLFSMVGSSVGLWWGRAPVVIRHKKLNMCVNWGE